MPPAVIAVAGASGAGKTRLIEALCDRVGAAAAVHFDDHFPGDQSFDDRAWLAAGAPFDQIETPAMVAELAALRARADLKLVAVEEPFGRGRPAIAPLVDRVVSIEVPLEIALARIIGRAATAGAVDPARALARIGRLIDGFVDRHRRIYQIVERRVAADCDLILDGERPIDELAAEVEALITPAPW